MDLATEILPIFKSDGGHRHSSFVIVEPTAIIEMGFRGTRMGEMLTGTHGQRKHWILFEKWTAC